jgi:hypothetical protein
MERHEVGEGEIWDNGGGAGAKGVGIREKREKEDEGKLKSTDRVWLMSVSYGLEESDTYHW